MKHELMTMVEALGVVDSALQSGHAMHAFRSGTGLQVVRIEKVKGLERRGPLKGYGEHPHVSEALRHAADDFVAGKRPYSKVYGTFDMSHPQGGEEGLYPMYLTGTHESTGRLDTWCKNGTFDAWRRDGKVEVILKGWKQHEIPANVRTLVMDCGETIVWSDDRGCSFQSSPTTWPGEKGHGCSTKPLSRPEGMKEHRVWIWRTTQTGSGDTFTDALNEAFEAKVEEADED